MSFVVKGFPGRTFESLEEYKKAKAERDAGPTAEAQPVNQSAKSAPAQLTAHILPAPKELLEARLASLEHQVSKIGAILRTLVVSHKQKTPTPRNREGLPIGCVLNGESKGQNFTLEVLVDGYLCSNGSIYPSLSNAAYGVSGNRRSGWLFWRNVEGRPIGEVTGRFERNAALRWPSNAAESLS